MKAFKFRPKLKINVKTEEFDALIDELVDDLISEQHNKKKNDNDNSDVDTSKSRSSIFDVLLDQIVTDIDYQQRRYDPYNAIPDQNIIPNKVRTLLKNDDCNMNQVSKFGDNSIIKIYGVCCKIKN